MLRKARILVIDDEEDICHFTKSVLERTGKFEVAVSTDSAKGIALAKTNQPDLVILDINMPDIDGGEVAQTLHEFKSTSDIPIIFLTGLLKKEEIENNSGKIGAHTYIAKPASPQELIEKIESALKIRD
ncbi:MAG: response regulator [Candidatus Omnitrophica bacterium]|nr:response regulator [Candidatus Omnitrophota bacterium]